MSTEAVIGKFVNRYFYTDVDVVGKIVDTFGKTGIIVESYTAEKDLEWKPEIIPGGFAGHCVNNRSQRWIFKPIQGGEKIRLRVSNRFKKDGFRIQDEPYKFYDYNF
jgi:hypothetical protein